MYRNGLEFTKAVEVSDQAAVIVAREEIARDLRINNPHHDKQNMQQAINNLDAWLGAVSLYQQNNTSER